MQQEQLGHSKGGMTIEWIAQQMAALGVNLPLQEWNRILSLKLVEASSAEFESAKEPVRRRQRDAGSLLHGRPGELNQAIHQSGAALRGMLEQPQSAGDLAPDLASGFSPDQARVIFLWGTSHLLDALGDALEKGPPSEEASGQLQKAIGNILRDAEHALENDWSSAEPHDKDYCYNCPIKYQACMNAPHPNPTVCQSNYAYCCAHCT